MVTSSRDSASPWYVSHLRVTWAIGFELNSGVVLHSLMEYFMKVLSVLLLLYSSKHSDIHVWSQVRLSCTQSRQCTDWSVWPYSLGWLLCLSVAGAWLPWCYCRFLSEPCSCIEPCVYSFKHLWFRTEVSMCCRGRFLVCSWITHSWAEFITRLKCRIQNVNSVFDTLLFLLLVIVHEVENTCPGCTYCMLHHFSLLLALKRSKE